MELRKKGFRFLRRNEYLLIYVAVVVTLILILLLTGEAA